MELSKVAFKMHLVVDRVQVGRGGSAESQAGADRQVRDRQVSCRGRFILVMKARSPRENFFISEGDVTQDKVKEHKEDNFNFSTTGELMYSGVK